MTEPEPTPDAPTPVPAALKRRNQVLAIVGVIIAALVPILFAYGVDVCAPLDAVGIELDACAEAPVPPPPAPAPAPSPAAPRDGGP